MKNIKVLLFALLLVAGFTSALTTKATAKKPTVFYWFNLDASGNPTTLITDPISTVCPDVSGTPCAKQYPDVDTQGSGSSRTVKPADYGNYTSEAYHN